MRRAAEPALWVALGAVLGAVITAGAFRYVRARSAGEPLPVLGQVPEFTLTERGGRPFGSRDLDGSPWVADFVFTRCSGVCPLLSAGMGRLQSRLGPRLERVRLVTFSVDPDHDTPAVLKSYAEGLGARGERWVFLTGARDVIHALVRDGFHLSVAAAEPGSTPAPGELVTHSDRWALVDGRSRVRAYYHGTESDAIDRLLADLDRLEAE